MLGELQEFRGGQVAALGHWLVVFRNNKPVSLYDTGVKVRRFINAPLTGAKVALLNTTPQDLSHQIRELTTLDGYTVPSMAVWVQVRLTPESDGAPSRLLDLIARHGARFFDSIEADIRQHIERHVRQRVAGIPAVAMLEEGPLTAVFPANTFGLGRAEVELTSIRGIDWQESILANNVRQARERDVAERAREQLDRDARERIARAQAHQQQLDSAYVLDQQALDAELAQRHLTEALDRARTLGVNPLAIAEPDVWRQISQQNAEVLSRLLESQHLYPMLRTSPDLMRAIVNRLSGGTTSLPMGRQAEMVLDGIDPQRVLSLPDATVHSPSDTSAHLDRAGLVVNSIVAEAWSHSRGSSVLNGAGYAIAPTSNAGLVLIVGQPEPTVPNGFADAFITVHNARNDPQLNSVGVYTAPGRTLLDAVSWFAHKISSDVEVRILLRENANRREAIVEINGPPDGTEAVIKTMTDPANPVLPAIENLIDDRAQIRFIRRGR